MKQINLRAIGIINDLTHFRYAKFRIFPTTLGIFLLSLLHFAAHKYTTEQ